MAGNDPFGPFQEALKTAIPLVINQRNIDAQKEQQDRAYMLAKQKLLADAMQAQSKVAIEHTFKIFEKSAEAGDERGMLMAAKNLEELGLPMPKDEMGQLILPGKWRKSDSKGFGSSSMGIYDKDTGDIVKPTSGLTGDAANLEAILGRKPTLQELEGYRKSGKSETNVTVAGNQPLTTGERSDAQKKIMGKDDSIAAVDRVLADFNPDYLNIEKRIGAGWDSLKNKSTTLQQIFGEVKPEDKKFMQDMYAWMSDAFEVMNTHINLRTGATMGVQEARRLMKEVPDPGDGVMPGDDPNTFLAKAKKVRQKLSLDRARYMTYLSKGIGQEGPLTEDQVKAKAKSNSLVSLDSFAKMIDDRGNTLATEYKSNNPQATETEVKNFVKRQLRDEFNLE